MPQSEAQAWWADVQHVRESIERRRADGAASASPAPRSVSSDGDRAVDPAPATEGRDVRASVVRDAGGRSVWIDPALEITTASHASSRRRPNHQEEADLGLARGRRPHAESERPRVRSRRSTADVTAGADRRRRDGALEGPHRSDRPLASAPSAPSARRTVRITGRPGEAPAAPRLVEVERRRPPRTPSDRIGARPDRIALWAVLLAFFLILVAATSSQAATPAAAASAVAPAMTAHALSGAVDGSSR
jgi:hypothetical protein